MINLALTQCTGIQLFLLNDVIFLHSHLVVYQTTPRLDEFIIQYAP